MISNQRKEIERPTAYNEGYEAFKQGKTMENNPYRSSNVIVLHLQWNFGWISRSVDEEKEKTRELTGCPKCGNPCERCSK